MTIFEASQFSPAIFLSEYFLYLFYVIISRFFSIKGFFSPQKFFFGIFLTTEFFPVFFKTSDFIPVIFSASEISRPFFQIHNFSSAFFFSSRIFISNYKISCSIHSTWKSIKIIKQATTPWNKNDLILKLTKEIIIGCIQIISIKHRKTALVKKQCTSASVTMGNES